MLEDRSREYVEQRIRAGVLEQRTADLLSSRISDARLAVLEGASHLANVERPDAFDAALLEHLGAASGSERA